MPNKQVLEAKQAQVSELVGKLKDAEAGVLVKFAGIKVSDDTAMRAELRKAGVSYKVYKNTLTARACQECGYGELKPLLSGMTAIAVSPKDPVAAAKVLCDYAGKIDAFEVLGGFVDKKVVDKATVEELAKTPSKEILVGKMLGSLQSSLYGLAYALQAIIDKQEKPAEAPAAAAAAAPAAQ